MLYYLGKGEEFKKEDCKEYKTEAGAIKAMLKTEDGVVWDEKGKKVKEVTGEETERQQEGQESTGEGAGEGENGIKEDKPENMLHEKENAVKEGNAAPQDEIIISQGKIKVMVVCDGTLNIRRSPAWGNKNICGRAEKGQTYYVKEIHMVDGKKMVRTIDDLYLSGMPEHVQFFDK